MVLAGGLAPPLHLEPPLAATVSEPQRAQSEAVSPAAQPADPRCTSAAGLPFAGGAFWRLTGSVTARGTRRRPAGATWTRGGVSGSRTECRRLPVERYSSTAGPHQRTTPQPRGKELVWEDPTPPHPPPSALSQVPRGSPCSSLCRSQLYLRMCSLRLLSHVTLYVVA